MTQEQEKERKAQLTTLVNQLAEVTHCDHAWRRECKAWVIWPAALLCVVVPAGVAAGGSGLGFVCFFTSVFVAVWLLIGIFGHIAEWLKARGNQAGLTVRGKAERAVIFPGDRNSAEVVELAREYIAIRRSPWRYFRGCWRSQSYRDRFKDL